MAIEITDSGYDAGKLPLPESVLSEWTKVLREYCERALGDIPFWHTERPQVGFLSAAVWRARGCALEEYSMPKGRDDGSYSGRNDLWFALEGKSWYVEAKFSFAKLKNGHDKCLRDLKKAVTEAEKNARSLNGSESRALAITFVSPVWDCNRMGARTPNDIETAGRALSEWRELVSKIEVDAKAWVVAKPEIDFPIPADNALVLGTWMLIKDVGGSSNSSVRPEAQ